ncbi:MAG: hypothetical protein JNL92_03775 [Opitutaceae bacterium]|nr:hypothetical protein [Opitutaceae bacterium]
MNFTRSLLAIVLFTSPVLAADQAPSLENYPLKSCVVSDEPLGSMGDAVKYTHREPGKPDRLVLFCCEGCIEDFKGDPAKFLAKLDAAAKAKSGGAGKSGGKAKQESKK